VQEREGEDMDTEKEPALIDNTKLRQALCPDEEILYVVVCTHDQ
jgi:hypothetical protein